MQAASVSCPRCRTPLGSAAPMALGTTVRCPKCGTPFTVSRSSPVQGRPSRPGTLAKTPPPTSKPANRRTAPTSASLFHNPLLVPAVAGGLLLLGMGLALAVYLIAGSGSGNRGEEVVKHPPARPTAEQPRPAPLAEPETTSPRPAPDPTRPPEPARAERPEEVLAPREAPPAEEVATGPRPGEAVKEPPHPLDVPPGEKKPDPAKEPAARVKPLSRNVLAGLGVLVKRQNADGSWGGDGDLFDGMMFFPGQPAPAGRGDVANTSIAALALLRAGYNPRTGWGSTSLRRAVEYVCGQVEKADRDSLFVSDVRGTLVQGKIGTHVDTFLAALLLAEAKGKLPDARGEARVVAALEKVVAKMQRNQKPDGTWANEGWAPVLSQALASKALNRARQAGVTVDEAVLERTARHAREGFAMHFQNANGGLLVGGPVGRGVPDGGAAGVALYAAAAYIGALQDAVQTHRHLGEAARGALNSPSATEEERREAKAQLKKLDDWEKVLADAVNALVRRLADQQFVGGFGTDGGEEYLSFTIISETLHTQNSKELPRWDKLMTDRLHFAQGADGSWAGLHCITGRTFCTATALLTLLADRAALARETAKR